MLSRIDGSYDIESILKIGPMPPLEAQLMFRDCCTPVHIELLQANIERAAAITPALERAPPFLADAWIRPRRRALLGAPLDRLLDLLPARGVATPLPPEVHLISDRIVIGKGARIAPGAMLEGPLSLARTSRSAPAPTSRSMLDR